MTVPSAVQALVGMLCLGVGTAMVYSPGAALMVAGAVLLALALWPGPRRIR